MVKIMFQLGGRVSSLQDLDSVFEPSPCVCEAGSSERQWRKLVEAEIERIPKFTGFIKGRREVRICCRILVCCTKSVTGSNHIRYKNS